MTDKEIFSWWENPENLESLKKIFGAYLHAQKSIYYITDTQKEELQQRCYVTLANKMRTFTPTTGKLETFFYRICRYEILSFFHKSGRSKRNPERLDEMPITLEDDDIIFTNFHFQNETEIPEFLTPLEKQYCDMILDDVPREKIYKMLGINQHKRKEFLQRLKRHLQTQETGLNDDWMAPKKRRGNASFNH